MPENLIWRNWHETVTQPVRRFEVLQNPDPSKSTIAGYNETTRKMQQLILEAAEADSAIRAVGGAWSFTAVAATDGTLVATQHLNYRFGLKASHLQRAYAPDNMPVFVQCGMTIAQLNKYLAGRGQAVPTSGASNGQTIAGALSTGTHGGAIRFGAVPEYVVAIHLATAPDGPTVWLERSSYPVVTDATIAQFNATPMRDDELFNAALVSFGCFGIILGVVLEPATMYYLHGYRREYPLSDAHWSALQNLDYDSMNLPDPNGRQPYHLEILQNVLDNERTLITAMYQEKTRPAGAASAKPEGGVGKCDSAADIIGFVTDRWDGSSMLASKVLSAAYKPFENVAGTPAEIFKDTTTRGRGASSAMGIPLQHAKQAFEIAAQAIKETEAPAFVALRFVKATQALLGFTMHQPVTVVTELDGAYGTRTLTAQRLFFQRVRAAGIPHSFHWGKMNDLSAENVRTAYGNRVDRWIAARQRLIRPELRLVFSNKFANDLGISL